MTWSKIFKSHISSDPRRVLYWSENGRGQGCTACSLCSSKIIWIRIARLSFFNLNHVPCQRRSDTFRSTSDIRRNMWTWVVSWSVRVDLGPPRKPDEIIISQCFTPPGVGRFYLFYSCLFFFVLQQKFPKNDHTGPAMAKKSLYFVSKEPTIKENSRLTETWTNIFYFRSKYRNNSALTLTYINLLIRLTVSSTLSCNPERQFMRGCRQTF